MRALYHLLGINMSVIYPEKDWPFIAFSELQVRLKEMTDFPILKVKYRFPSLAWILKSSAGQA